MEDYLRTDAMLMEILQERKTITGFLDAVFGFLRRNTDFYHTKKDADEKIGFPKGMRDKILYGAMQRYDPDCWLQTMATNDRPNFVPPAIEEVTLETEQPQFSMPTSSKDSAESKPSFLASDYKNGAVFGRHCWSQSLKELEVQLHLPKDLQNSKQLCVDIKAQHIKISSKKIPQQMVLEGKLSQRVKHNDAVWTIDNGRLLISCDKSKECWWDKLFEGDEEIDVTKLDCERNVDELPQCSQSAIEKLRVQQIAADEEHRIRPEADPEQAKTLERLRQAWDVEGSPFKGQPFDPAVVRMS
ncbi:nudC domain-containing protein 3 [Scaptodrosophila lebanonensis]|uniref:Nuclear migration protein nudC n=1 Tax=Drosophila lebanonensis TaxID=7225 RepID=A0A6J2T5N7_DROLE|nr:nudC domain-containing protein 3 [Scaptodrosophila lebanonensis]